MLQVLNLKLKLSFSPLLLTTYPLVLFGVDVVYGVAALKMYHVLPLVAYLIFPTVKIWLTFLQLIFMRMGGEMEQESMLLMESWKSQVTEEQVPFDKEDAHSHKSFVKSLRPVVAKMGNYMRITYETATLQMMYHAQYTVQLLMLLQVD